MELENIILSEVTQSQKNIHGMHSLISRYSLEAWNTQDTIHISNDVQEEGRSGPWFWKGSVQQCREIPEQGSAKGWMGVQGDGRGLMGLWGSWKPGKGKSFEM